MNALPGRQSADAMPLSDFIPLARRGRLRSSRTALSSCCGFLASRAVLPRLGRFLAQCQFLHLGLSYATRRPLCQQFFQVPQVQGEGEARA